MKVSLLIFTDGRYDCLERTLESFFQQCDYPFIEKYIVNDCLERVFLRQLENLAWKYSCRVRTHVEKRGFSGTYHDGWKIPKGDYVFSTEDDFTFSQKVDIEQMLMVMEANPHLAQLCLKRQAWNEQEKKAGGIQEQWPKLYQDKTDGVNWWNEHRLFFSTNPSLYPRRVIERGWPDMTKSEAEFSKKLFEDTTMKSAYWGKKFDPPQVHHIGLERVGNGY